MKTKVFPRVGLLAILCWGLSAFSATTTGSEAFLLEIKGSIGPATGDYVKRGLNMAQEESASLVVLQMDTPGGLDRSMRDIIKAILSSSVPVVSYVAPSGSRAASAGTYILYASHVAAMAPATTLGAATPVQIGGLPEWPKNGGKPEKTQKPDKEHSSPSEEKSGEEEVQEVESEDAMERKLVNDAVAYIRGLASRHGRNAEWAELAVRKGVTLTATEALEKNVIDVVADNIPELLEKIDARQVQLATGERTLSTKGLVLRRVEADWRYRLLAVITDPNIAYILMLVGIYGLIFELANPGGLFPGVIGAICLILALYAFQLLPINYTGMALMLLGIAFMLAEAFVPSFGILGLGGVVAFVVGSIILMDEAQLHVSLPLIGGTALLSSAFFLWVISKLVRMRRRKAAIGREEMIGLVGRAVGDIDPIGKVRVHSETWNAHTAAAIADGHRVRVKGMDGLTLEVEPLEPEDHNEHASEAKS